MSPDRMSTTDFVNLMTRIAASWNTGDAASAVTAFADDAVHVELPDGRSRRGRQELLEFFGGTSPPAMRMTWHHLAFDEAAQVGFGEYTFETRQRWHGVAVVEVRGQRILRWREYQFRSAESWEDFARLALF